VTRIGVPAFTMIALVWLGAQAEAQTPCPELVRMRRRGHGGLETCDEGTVIGALRSIISSLPGRGGDTQLRK
jgi:hypothetical protein